MHMITEKKRKMSIDFSQKQLETQAYSSQIADQTLSPILDLYTLRSYQIPLYPDSMEY
jgi:hypothetical protein